MEDKSRRKRAGSNTRGMGKLVASKDVGSQLGSSDLTFRRMLKGGPVLSLDQSLLDKPLGDRLLTEARPLEELCEPLSKGCLAAGDFNGALESGNVRFIHNHARYTTTVVNVNDHGRVPDNNDGCTVLYMPVRPRKNPAPQFSEDHAKKVRVRTAARGPDGKTLGERLEACRVGHMRRFGLERYTQTEMAKDATRAVGRDPDRLPEKDWVITQAGVSLILKNQISESPASIAFALVYGVEAAWLQYGIGPRNALDRLLDQKNDAN